MAPDLSALSSGTADWSRTSPAASLVSGAQRVNLIGYFSGALGLGVAARALGQAAFRRAFEVTALDLDPSQHEKLRDVGEAGFRTVKNPDDLPSGINLFVLPPLTVTTWLTRSNDFARLLERRDCLNALFTFWELPVLPATWSRALELFDAVIAPSGFIEGALDFALSGTRVLRGLTPVDMPMGIKADRARFGLPADAFIAVTSFDPLSDVERKNPHAALKAFRLAFGAKDAARLVVKLNVPPNGYADERLNRTVLQPLLQQLRSEERILVIADELAYRDVLSLYASADAFVSLHRAEGLGLALLESMALGKPVVATGWSGNKAYMSPANACPVRHKLIPAKGTHPAYVAAMKSNAPFWAEPDVEDAALWLSRLAADSDLCHTIGSRAQETFLRYQTEAASMSFIDDLIALQRHQFANPTSIVRHSRHEQINEVRRALLQSGMSGIQRVKALVQEGIDRHIGWRFKSARQAN